MTEKSEDQAYLQSRHQPASEVISSLQLENRQLKSDLALAVEALENIVKHREDEKEARTFLFPDPNQIAQEALGKINKEKHE